MTYAGLSVMGAAQQGGVQRGRSPCRNGRSAFRCNQERGGFNIDES